MTKKLKAGIILIMIGIGIPLTLFFFQKDGELFKITVEKKDALREAEIKTLNSMFDLMKEYDRVYPKALDLLRLRLASHRDDELGKMAERLVNLGGDFDRVLESIKDITALAMTPDSRGRVLGTPSEEYDALAGQIVMKNPAHIKMGIPYNYTIGVGMIIFLSGLSLVILQLVEKKGQKA